MVKESVFQILFAQSAKMVIVWAGTTRVDYYSSAVVLIKSLHEIPRQVSEQFYFSLLQIGTAILQRNASDFVVQLFLNKIGQCSVSCAKS